MKTILFAIGVLFFLVMIYAAFVSYNEKEKRAVKVSLLLAIVFSAPYLLVSKVSLPMQNEIELALLVLTLILFSILFFPVRRRKDQSNDNPTQKYDERDTMFSRKELLEGSERFKQYYDTKQENKLLDDKFREKPGLMSPQSVYYDPLSYSAADASFRAVECFKEIIDGQPSVSKKEIGIDEITNYIKRWAVKLGALDVGVTELKDYHLYSNKGRGEAYGKQIANNHKYAIAFTVEMDKEQLGHAPHGPTIMESAQQYFNSGAVAVQVAEFIRNLGYEAKAHIDANYEVICPLVARDAGLGEIGRMGLLMTPKLGPRIRISVVTTEMPLLVDERKYDSTAIDFCRICKKCADVCPVKAIPFGDKEKDDYATRWRVNSEFCFTYWCTAGTDCGQCMSICPYSHPDNLLHNFIRWGIRNNSIFRRLALKLDDLFYGS